MTKVKEISRRGRIKLYELYSKEEIKDKAEGCPTVAPVSDRGLKTCDKKKTLNNL